MIKDPNYLFKAWGYSDDCAGISGSTLADGTEGDEYSTPNTWFELWLNGRVIGECRMAYDGDWSFEFRSMTNKLLAGKQVTDEWD